MEELAGPIRRTQRERREATRAALLDATVDSLIADGWARLTTRGIAERAGVTPGALQHHFASKADLVAESVTWVLQRLMRELLAQQLPRDQSPEELLEALIDRAWEVHRGPLIGAIAELSFAARQDALLRTRMAQAQADVDRLGTAAAAMAFPFADAEDQAQRLRTCLATLRGLAMVGYSDAPARDAAWPATRAHLLALLAAVRPDREAEP